MIKTSVSGEQDAIKAIQDEIAKLDVASITVGIHEGSAKPAEGDINMATLGAIQHFGNEHIPARPWLDVGVETGNEEYVQIIEGAIEAGEDLNSAINRVGVMAVGKVQQYMTQLKSPANAPSTIARKKSSNPLIDTGALRASVTYQLQDGPVEEGI